MSKTSYSYWAQVGLVEDPGYTTDVTGTARADSREEAVTKITATLRATGMEPLDMTVDGQRA